MTLTDKKHKVFLVPIKSTPSSLLFEKIEWLGQHQLMEGHCVEIPLIGTYQVAESLLDCNNCETIHSMEFLSKEGDMTLKKNPPFDVINNQESLSMKQWFDHMILIINEIGNMKLKNRMMTTEQRKNLSNTLWDIENKWEKLKQNMLACWYNSIE